MYMNFWYPVCTVAELTATPQRVRVLKHDFVVFRGKDGKPAVLSDTCVHRGGSLAGGKCKEDGTVQCPYHGWRFTAEGDCTRIPSLGIKAKIPARARVDAYPTQEKYGVVFAFLGDLPEDGFEIAVPLQVAGHEQGRLERPRQRLDEGPRLSVQVGQRDICPEPAERPGAAVGDGVHVGDAEDEGTLA